MSERGFGFHGEVPRPERPSEGGPRFTPEAVRAVDAELAKGPIDEAVVMRAVALGVKPGAWLPESYQKDEQQIVAIRNAMRSAGVETELVDTLVYRPDLIAERMHQEPKLAERLEWDDGRSVRENMERLMDDPERSEVIGMAVGYPDSALRGFTREKMLEREGIPSTVNLRILGMFAKGKKFNGRLGEVLAAATERISSHVKEGKIMDDMTVEEVLSRLEGGSRVKAEQGDKDFVRKFYHAIGASEDIIDFLLSRNLVRIGDEEGGDVFEVIVYDHPDYGGAQAPDVQALRKKVEEGYSALK